VEVDEPSTQPALDHRRGCWSRLRTPLSVMALVLGLWMFFWVIVLGWATGTVADRDEFSTRTVELLESAAIRTQLAEQLADEIVENGPSTLVSYRAVLVLVIETVVQTDAFKGIFQQAVRSAHDAVFDTDADSIVLNLADSLGIIVGTLQVTAPDVAKQIPANITDLAVQVTEQVRALQLGQVAQDLDDLLGTMFLVGIVAVGASIIVAHKRRNAVLRVGIGLVVIAALGLVAMQLGRYLGTRGISDPGLRAAVRSSVNLLTADLQTLLITTAIIGLLIAALANASARENRRLQLSTARSWFERRVLAPPKTSLGRVGRGIAFVLVGLVVLSDPGTWITFAVGITAAWIIYLGLTEVILVVGRARTPVPATASASAGDSTRDGGSDRERGAGLRWGRIAALATALVLVIVAGAVVATRSARSTAQAAGEVECNGYADLCDRTVDEVVFATSHNSMSAVREPGWLFGEHFGGIRAQLEYGIRGFLIDTHYGVPSGLRTPGIDTPVILTDAAAEIGRDQLTEPSSAQQTQQLEQISKNAPVGVSGAQRDVYLCHNYCELGATKLSDALGQVQQFLVQNPNEVIVLFLEDYVTPNDMASAFATSGLADHVYTSDARQPLPTLRTMIDAGQQVLVLSEHMGGTPGWYRPGFEVSEETPYTFATVDDFSCAANRGGTGKPLFLLNHWLTSGAPDVDASTRANSYDVLMGRIEKCQRERDRRVNLVAVNFYDRGDLLRVVNDLNGVSE
jgi:hypothetical protein